MPKTISKEPFVRQSISFPKSLLDEVRRIVVDDERHGNLSRYFQDLARRDVAYREDNARREQIAKERVGMTALLYDLAVWSLATVLWIVFVTFAVLSTVDRFHRDDR